MPPVNQGSPVPIALSVQQVAKTLHVSESTVRRLIEAAEFPGTFRVGRKLLRIPAADVLAYQRRMRLLTQADDERAWTNTDTAEAVA